MCLETENISGGGFILISVKGKYAEAQIMCSQELSGSDADQYALSQIKMICKNWFVDVSVIQETMSGRSLQLTMTGCYELSDVTPMNTRLIITGVGTVITILLNIRFWRR